MNARAVVAHEAGKPPAIEALEIEGPKSREALVEIKATGVCHTDAFTLTGEDPEGNHPAALGPQGAGVVAEKGPGVAGFEPGDHMIPLCVP